MLLSVFRDHLKASLADLYPEREINTFFFRLVEFHLGMTRVEVALAKDRILTLEEEKKLKNAQNRLKTGEPLQYVLGVTEFFGLTFRVDPNVLIPRPETEELVEWILKHCKQEEETGEISVLDIGTGSGCIAVSLAKELVRGSITAMDISAKALKTASKNAEINAVNINFEQASILGLDKLTADYDIIVSNPPYVRHLEKTAMHDNVLRHEPETALYVNDDEPLIFYEKISALASRHLKPGGKLYFEINQYLAEETCEVVRRKGFANVEVKEDLFGNPRMLRATR